MTSPQELQAVLADSETGNCGRCNRQLKDAKSRKEGFGPKCLKIVKAEAAKVEFKKNQTKLFEGAMK